MEEQIIEEQIMEELIFTADVTDHNKRIDKYLSEQLENTSRSYLQKLIKENRVSVDQKPVKANYKLSEGEDIQLLLPEAVELDVVAEDIPLEIIYEDQDLLIVNKPKGMVVHPSAGHHSQTLVNAILFHCKGNLSSINGVLRPGIVHRIDMNTTGALIICKNDVAHQSLSEQLKEHTITRKYRAIVWNNLKEDSGTVDQPIGRHPVHRKKMSLRTQNGKRAVTHYRVIERFGRFCYIECTLETGRTHQIRVHMSSIGHPILGDEIYGPQKSPYPLQGQCLHAMVLGFIHPSTREYMEFEAPLPDYFGELLQKL